MLCGAERYPKPDPLTSKSEPPGKVGVQLVVECVLCCIHGAPTLEKKEV